MPILSDKAEYLLSRASGPVTWELCDLENIQFDAAYARILIGEIEVNKVFAALSCATVADFINPIKLSREFQDSFQAEFSCGWTYECMQYVDFPWIEIYIDCRTEDSHVIFEISFDRPPCSAALNCMGWDDGCEDHT